MFRNGIVVGAPASLPARMPALPNLYLTIHSATSLEWAVG